MVFVKASLNANSQLLIRPLVSVIMPVKDAADTVKTAIDSIINQTFRHFEFIIVNDGSTDRTAHILNTYEDQRITIIHQDHSGIARSLNKAIKQSRSPFIARMDADDIASPDRLALQYQFLQDHPEIGVVSSLVKFAGNIEKQKGYFLYCEWINSLRSSREIYINRFVDSPIAHPTVMLRKEVMDKYGYYDESELPEDYELWLRLMHEGVKFSKIDRELLTWTDRTNRLSRTHSNYGKNAFYKIKSKYLICWIKKKFPDKLPKIWIWGWGKSVFQKSADLNDQLPISGYIDVSTPPVPSQKRTVIHYSDIPPQGNVLILSYVGDRLGKSGICQYLMARGYKAGIDFYMMA
ncbi:glycosyltransferase family A protein [Fulvivirgaceae bacterium BMA12]|uniref:Glycosyltransferase family A protein n=1 Tax=Agaribacillus aureus TaxID=3051825 RepID=A0ABT8LFY6_9BACT|nr:glycosyltransferase family A protein [Fulvivirgaceae bacterium BMA12]